MGRVIEYEPGLWGSDTAEMKDMRPARPKNLATKTVAWPCASALSIHCKHGLRIHVSLHPFRRIRHPLQLISLPLFLSLSLYMYLFFYYICQAKCYQQVRRKFRQNIRIGKKRGGCIYIKKSVDIRERVV